MPNPPTTGILILNFGGPKTLAEVRPFLFQLFSDPAILLLPTALRYPLAAWIAATRSRAARAQYQAIGGGSPINRLTCRQAAALAERLPGIPVEVGFRYSWPTIAERFDTLVSAGVTRVIGLPLYPHYSHTTTGSGIAALTQASAMHPEVAVDTVDAWYDCPAFVEAVQAQLQEARARFAEPPYLLFSAHGLPLRHVEREDPYPIHIEASMERVMDGLDGMAGHSLSYQSRVGRTEWLGPDTGAEIKRLADEGVRRVLICPISFVSDHIETLHEIDITYRAVAKAAGIEQFERMESLNDSPRFIDALVQIAKAAIGPTP